MLRANDKLVTFVAAHSSSSVAASQLSEAAERVWEGIPDVDAATAVAVWAAVAPLECVFRELPRTASEDNRNTDGTVHHAVDALLRAVDSALRHPMRQWYERKYHDCIPDFTYTQAREGVANEFTMRLTIEVKPREHRSATSGQLRKSEDVLKEAGQSQALQRAVLRTLVTLGLRAEERVDAERAWGFSVATNGAELQVVRASTSHVRGAVGTHFWCTPWLPLWPLVGGAAAATEKSGGRAGGRWAGRRRAGTAEGSSSVGTAGGSADPFVATSTPPCPSGLVALARLLLAPSAQLCGVRDTLRSSIVLDGRNWVLPLEERIGSGGFCDVYSATLEGVRVAVKVGRTAKVSLEEEVACMTALGGRGPLPRLVGRSFDAATRRTTALVLSPLGTPLTEVRKACTSPHQCADLAWRVARGVLAALRTAHAAGWLHCDVRPSNVVLVEEEVVLVDWGLSVKRDGTVRMGVCGVEAFVADDVLESCAQPMRHWSPSVEHDLVAVGYTYAALWGGDAECLPPWAHRGRAAHHVLAQRTAWMAEQADDSVVRRFLAVVVEAPEEAYGFFDGEVGVEPLPSRVEEGGGED